MEVVVTTSAVVEVEVVDEAVVVTKVVERPLQPKTDTKSNNIKIIKTLFFILNTHRKMICITLEK